MKQLFFIIILSLSYSTIFCQAGQTVTGNGGTSWSINRHDVLVPSVSNESIYDTASLRDVKGSPYENELFQKGGIYYKGELLMEDVLLRYNIYADQFEVKEDAFSEETTAIAYDSNIVIRINGASYVYIPYTDVKNEGNYYKVVTNNKNYNLYKKHQVIYKEKVAAKTSFHKDTPATFARDDIYYLKSETGKFIELPSRVSKLAKTLAPKSDKIKSFLKENNIDTKDEKSLARLIRYYDSIMAE